MQTATSETESKSLDLSVYVHHYTLRAPCSKGQGTLGHASLSSCFNGCMVSVVRPGLTLVSLQCGIHPFDGERVDLEPGKPKQSIEASKRTRQREGLNSLAFRTGYSQSIVMHTYT